MLIIKHTIYLILLILLSSCTSFQTGSVNDPTKSTIGPNLVPIGPAGKYSTKYLLYENQEVDKIEVAYNIYQGFILQNPIYWLTIVIKNKGDAATEVSPTVELYDSNGIEIPAHTYDGFVCMASSITSGTTTIIPTIPATQPSNTSYSGTIMAPSGKSYYYSGVSSSQLNTAESLASGLAFGAAMQAQQMNQIAVLLISWSDAYWIREHYTIKPDRSIVGTLTFPAPKTTPLTLRIGIGSREYLFTTGKELVRHD